LHFYLGEKMTKIRQPISANYAMQESLRALPVTQLADAVGKSTGFIYKCSDPDEAQEINVRDALIIEDLVYRLTGNAPFRELFIRNISKDRPALQGGVRDGMLRMQEELGSMSAKIRQSTSDDSESGKRLSLNERAAIMVELEAVQRALNDLFFQLSGQEKGEHANAR